MNKAVLLAPNGIGDGLLMMIAHHQLKIAGYDVTLYHEKAALLCPLFPESKIALPGEIPPSDLLIVLNDNSKRAWDLIRNRKKTPELRFLFPTPCKAMQPEDFLFSPKKPVASNIQEALKHILGRSVTKENGLYVPKSAKVQKRILIHPTSADVKRNWLPRQFMDLARQLTRKGFTVAFATSPEERPYWKFVEREFLLPEFSSLLEMASFISSCEVLIGNDSGIGHLASNIGVPTFTISGNKKRLQLWRPDFTKGEIATVPFPLPNFKGIHFRMRENLWQCFLPVKTVTKKFLKFYEKCSSDSL